MTKVTVENEEGRQEYELIETFALVGEVSVKITKEGNLCRKIITRKIGNLAKVLGMLEIAKKSFLDEGMRRD